MKLRKLASALFPSVLLLLASNDALALGKVSRACNFATLPYGTKTVASLFFSLLGAPSYVQNLADAPLTTQQQKWILESLTTDYGSARYYLYAESAQFRWNYPDPLFNPTGNWWKMRVLASHMESSVVSDAIKAYPTLSIFYANRMLLFSARAGAKSIVEDLGWPAQFRVEGKHMYQDAGSPTGTWLSNTVATDCNITDWGLEGAGIFNR